MDFEINDLGKVGLIVDQPSHLLPPEAFNLMQNVRFKEDVVVKLKGDKKIFGDVLGEPHFLLNLIDPAQSWWIYMSLDKGFVFDGLAHYDITRTSGPYAAARSHDWDAGLLGGIPVINNGVDVPQIWPNYNPSIPLEDLPNWPTTLRAKAVKPFGPYLVGVNITKSGTNYPHMVKWSHPAEVGSVPSSWDETDLTKDAGENELPDVKAGNLVNLGTLRGQMFLYKQQSVWRMVHIGGRFVFKFDSFIDTNGLIAPRGFCLTPDGTRHVAIFQDDIIIHDGQTVETLLTSRLRRWLFDTMDPATYRSCFCFPNFNYNEVWFCFPTRGNIYPNQALIWNVRNNAFTTATIGFRCAESGAISESVNIRWSDPEADVPWDDFEGVPWNLSSRRKVAVGYVTGEEMIRQIDEGSQREGTDYLSRIRRTGLALMGQKRTGAPIVDFKRRKLFRRVWIKAKGDPFLVRLGVQEHPDGGVKWHTPVVFNPAVDSWVDLIGSGRAVAIEFSSADKAQWEIHGYKPEVSPLGNF
jgi:hypothetical protein